MDPNPNQQYPISFDGGSSDRFPQWSLQETRDFIVFRGELDQNFMETKRNKPLWEMISARMNEMGYARSSDQCKCKWKNLVTRYKGSEAMEAEGIRQQFPFYKELQAIYGSRMQRMLWIEAEVGHFKKPEFSDEDEDEDEIEKGNQRKKRKVLKGVQNQIPESSSNENRMINEVKEIMEEFMKQQMEMEMEWMRVYEAREEERRSKEIEWRRRMEALENERFLMEKNIKEKEEQRRVRGEERADKRDALITALLNKLRREDE